MPQLKAQLDTLQDKISKQLALELSQAKAKLTDMQQRLCDMAEFSALLPEQQQQLALAFTQFAARVENQQLIAVVRDTLRRFEEIDYQGLLCQLATWTQAASVTPPDSGIPGELPKPTEGTAEPRIDYVPYRTLRVNFDKAWLADESDVERYLSAMREVLLAEIRQGKRIQT
jgi:hypothetical protein